MTELTKSLWPVLLLMAFLGTSLTLENAEARRRGRGDLHFGGGLLREMNTYKIGSNESNFTGWGAAAFAGMEFELAGDVGLLFEAEYARHEMLNTLQNSNYLEKSTNTVLMGKVGFTYGLLSLGLGLANNRIDIDSVQSNAVGIRTSYDGLTYHAFGQLTLPMQEQITTLIEGKYGTGSLGGMTYSELQIGLRLQFRPF